MKPILVTMGEPAGIGPDICLALAGRDVPVVVLGDELVLRERARLLNIPIDGLNILHQPGLSGDVRPGQLNVAHAGYVMQLLESAVTRVLSGEFAALVTAPVHKGILNEAGFQFTGHTEFLAHQCDVESVVMLLASGRMRVALATTHLPLRAVPDAITQDGLKETIHIIHKALKHDFEIDAPRIAVAGLNPHAGEGGHLGREEIEVITPVLDYFRQSGVEIAGPLSADTLFTEPQMMQYDVVLAMYHDQGLPVLKHASFGRAVNITLGLPIIRTSVDHGTALELAGTNTADSGSLLSAVEAAVQMVCSREEICQLLA